MAEEDIQSISANVQKTSLKCSMFMTKGYFEQDIKFCYLVWNLKGYSNMETDVCYTKNLLIADWVLKLTKTEGDITLVMTHRPLIEEIVCYVSPNCGESEEFSTPHRTTKLGYDRHSLKIPRSSVTNIRTKLEPDVLGLYFRYATVKYSWKNPLPSLGVPVGEEKMFSGEMMKLYETGRHSDFTIETPHEKFNVHKIILESRSETFKKLFQDDGEIRNYRIVDTSTASMNCVLRYMYSGELNFRELDQDDIGEVIRLANKLRIDILELRCVSYSRFMRNLSTGKVRSLAKLQGVRDLCEITEELLEHVKDI